VQVMWKQIFEHRLNIFTLRDQDGDVINILVTKRRDRQAAKRFFRKALKHQGQVPWQLVTDKLRTYLAAHREPIRRLRRSLI
jgi:transposase-like protein